MAKSLVRLAAMGSVCALLATATGAAAADPPHISSGKSKPSATARRSASEAGARRSISGGPTNDDESQGVESPELKALREAERELFPAAAPMQGSPWPSDVPLVMPGDVAPHVHATGVPPAAPSPPAPGDGTRDLSWLSKLQLPDLPVRWDDRVVRYLEYFRDDPRGHVTFANLFRHSGRWREMMRRALRAKALPEDLVWVSMIESGFDATARSPAGAVGLWQFMPETGRIYGLTMDRWLDQRMSPELETAAAADFLADLHRRFGSWELALASYNMGYGGLASVVRRYNTNDFWSLSRTEGTLPWETTLYVPKILAAAIVSHNLASFGFADLQLDTPVDTDEVEVPPGTPFTLVAQVAGCTAKDIESLNPELRAGRAPPAADSGVAYPVRVPRGKGDAVTQGLAKMRAGQPPFDRYVVRFGETLDQIAAAHRTTTQKLVELNAIAPGEVVRGGTVLLVPHADAPPTPQASTTAPGIKPVVIVPADELVYPDRKRVFYRVLVGDTLRDIAAALHVSVDDLDRWNDIDPSARLQEGMTLQAYVPTNADLSRVAVAGENDVRVLAVGSEEFFAAMEQERGFRRVAVTARAGDTLEAIGKRFDVSVRTMERINRRGRNDKLEPGDSVVVWVPSTQSVGTANVATAANAPAPNGPLPTPPVPDLLP
jgi:membrane-bound lytic murein transglycosylase D